MPDPVSIIYFFSLRICSSSNSILRSKKRRFFPFFLPKSVIEKQAVLPRRRNIASSLSLSLSPYLSLFLLSLSFLFLLEDKKRRGKAMNIETFLPRLKGVIFSFWQSIFSSMRARAQERTTAPGCNSVPAITASFSLELKAASFLFQQQPLLEIVCENTGA